MVLKWREQKRAKNKRKVISWDLQQEEGIKELKRNSKIIVSLTSQRHANTVLRTQGVKTKVQGFLKSKF